MQWVWLRHAYITDQCMFDKYTYMLTVLTPDYHVTAHMMMCYFISPERTDQEREEQLKALENQPDCEEACSLPKKQQ